MADDEERIGVAIGAKTYRAGGRSWLQIDGLLPWGIIAGLVIAVLFQYFSFGRDMKDLQDWKREVVTPAIQSHELRLNKADLDSRDAMFLEKEDRHNLDNIGSRQADIEKRVNEQDWRRNGGPH